MGREQDKVNSDTSTRASSARSRICLRKGCDHIYTPRRWNQRYCQNPECMRLVQRWQAAQRRAKFRAVPETRQRLAAAERQRRRQPRTKTPVPNTKAWSRSKRIFHGDLCQRPGCYEPPRDSIRTEAKYCGISCRQAMQRVQDRERKWLRRKSYAGRIKRQQEYQSRNARRRQAALKNELSAGGEFHASDTEHPAGAVLLYRRDAPSRLCSSPSKEDHSRDSEAPYSPRPHPPPSS